MKSCASSIADSIQQVDRMRTQLRSLSAACDTLESLAAPLKPGEQAQVAASGVGLRNHEELAEAHISAIQAATGQLAGLRHGSLCDEARARAVEAESLARLQDWVTDVSAGTR